MATQLNREQLECRRAAAEAALAATLAALAAAQAETHRCLAALADAQGDLDTAVHELIVHDAQRRLREEAARKGRRLSADAARVRARRDALRAMALQTGNPPFRVQKAGAASSSRRSGHAAQAEFPSSLSADQLAGA